MVALQILVLSAQVRILVPQLCGAKLSLLRKRTISTPVTIDTGHIPEPLRLLRKRAISTPSLLIRGISPCPCALKGLSDFAVRNPGPGRCSDEHFLVKPFGGVLARGLRQAFAGRLRCSFASQTRCRSAASLVRPRHHDMPRVHYRAVFCTMQFNDGVPYNRRPDSVRRGLAAVTEPPRAYR